MIKIALMTLMLGLLVVSAPRVLAADTTLGAGSVAHNADDDAAFFASDFSVIVGNLIAAVLGILGVIFLILMIYAGLLWMTAGGNADNVKKAKSILTNAVIGLVITLSSYAIAATVLRYLQSSAY